MKKINILVLLLLMLGCNPSIQSPITIERRDEIMAADGRALCALRIRTYESGWGNLWTTFTVENCQYKVGDVLK